MELQCIIVLCFLLYVFCRIAVYKSSCQTDKAASIAGYLGDVFTVYKEKKYLSCCSEIKFYVTILPCVCTNAIVLNFFLVGLLVTRLRDQAGIEQPKHMP